MNGRVSIEGANQVSSGDSSVEFKEEEEGVIAVEEHLVITFIYLNINRHIFGSSSLIHVREASKLRIMICSPFFNLSGLTTREIKT